MKTPVLALLMACTLIAAYPIASWAEGSGGSSGGSSGSSSGGSSGGSDNGDSGDSSDSGGSQISKFDQGVILVEAENYPDAEALFRRIVQQDPKNADAWNYLGFSQRMQGNLDDSLTSYQKALALNPDHIGANEYLGELYLQMKSPEQADLQLMKLQALCGDCEEAEELEEAIADYRAANPS